MFENREQNTSADLLNGIVSRVLEGLLQAGASTTYESHLAPGASLYSMLTEGLFGCIGCFPDVFSVAKADAGFQRRYNALLHVTRKSSTCN